MGAAVLLAQVRYVRQLHGEGVSVKSVMVMTAGVAALPEPDATIALEAVRHMARNPEPEPSMYSMTPTAPEYLTKEQRVAFFTEHTLLTDGGRTLLIHDPLLKHRIWVKKDDWRGAAPEDKRAWGIPVDTSYVITAMLPEEY